MFVDFKVPVNNLSFYVLNTHSSGGTSAEIQYWVNWQYAGSWYLRGTGGYWNAGPPVFVNFASVPRITGIKIIPNGNQDAAGNNYPFIYDDFTFTPDLNVNITNPRVNGNLQGTTQKALLGADARFQAASNRSGGTYSWTVTGGQYAQRVSTSADQTAILERWTESGTYRVTASYTLNGITVSSYVDVDVIAPTLTSFTANMTDPDNIFTGDCARGYPAGGIVTAYQLGCSDFETERGIFFSATAQIPSAVYLSSGPATSPRAASTWPVSAESAWTFPEPPSTRPSSSRSIPD